MTGGVRYAKRRAYMRLCALNMKDRRKESNEYK